MIAVLSLAGLRLLALVWTGFRPYPIYTHDAQCENGVCRHPEEVFVVNQKYDDASWDFVSLKYRHVRAIFCSNYEPEFDANNAPIPGIQIGWLKYEDRGTCWNIAPKELGYKINFYHNGEPVLDPPALVGRLAVHPDELEREFDRYTCSSRLVTGMTSVEFVRCCIFLG